MITTAVELVVWHGETRSFGKLESRWIILGKFSLSCLNDVVLHTFAHPRIKSLLIWVTELDILYQRET